MMISPGAERKYLKRDSCKEQCAEAEKDCRYQEACNPVWFNSFFYLL